MAQDIIQASGLQFGPVRVCEQNGTGRANYDMIKASKAERIFLCYWKDQAALVNFLTGTTSENNSINLWRTPQAYPWATWLLCTHVEVEGTFGKHQGMNQQGPYGSGAYPYALVTATYTSPDYNPGEMGSQSVDYADEVIKYPTNKGVLKWATGSDAGKTIDPEDCTPYIVTVATFTQTIKNLKTLPVAAIISVLGAPLNLEEFFGGDPKTVMFLGGKSYRRYTVGAVEQWDLTYSFKWRSVPWDQLLDPSDTTAVPPNPPWQTVEFINGTPLYQSSDFSILFNAATQGINPNPPAAYNMNTATPGLI